MASASWQWERGRRTAPDGLLLGHVAGLVLVTCLGVGHDGVQNLALALRWPGLLVLALAAAWQHRDLRRLRPSLAFVGVAFFLGVAGLSMLWAGEPIYAGERTASLVLLGLATLVGVRGRRSPADSVAWYLDVWFWLAVAVVLAGAAVPRFDNSRFLGIFDRATIAGWYLAFLLPSLWHRLRWGRGPWIRMLAGAVLILLVGQLLLTGSRLAILSGAVTSVALGVVYFRARFVAFVLAMGLLGGLAVAGHSGLRARATDAVVRVVRPQSLGTFTGRLERWEFGLEQFALQPWIGHGFGASREIARQNATRRFDLDRGEKFVLHSDQIEVLVDVGLAGMLPFASFWLGIAVAAWRVCASEDGTLRRAALPIVAMTVLAGADTFTHGSFLAAGGVTAFPAWLAIGVLLFAAEGARQQPGRAVWAAVTAAPSERPCPVDARSLAAPPWARLPSVRHVVRGR